MKPAAWLSRAGRGRCISRSLGVAPAVLHSWRQTVSTATMGDRGETSERELRRLRRENADLKRDREALPKSIAAAVRTRR